MSEIESNVPAAARPLLGDDASSAPVIQLSYLCGGGVGGQGSLAVEWIPIEGVDNVEIQISQGGAVIIDVKSPPSPSKAYFEALPLGPTTVQARVIVGGAPGPWSASMSLTLVKPPSLQPVLTTVGDQGSITIADASPGWVYAITMHMGSRNPSIMAGVLPVSIAGVTPGTYSITVQAFQGSLWTQPLTTTGIVVPALPEPEITVTVDSGWPPTVSVNWQAFSAGLTTAWLYSDTHQLLDSNSVDSVNGGTALSADMSTGVTYRVAVQFQIDENYCSRIVSTDFVYSQLSATLSNLQNTITALGSTVAIDQVVRSVPGTEHIVALFRQAFVADTFTLSNVSLSAVDEGLSLVGTATTPVLGIANATVTALFSLSEHHPQLPFVLQMTIAVPATWRWRDGNLHWKHSLLEELAIEPSSRSLVFSSVKQTHEIYGELEAGLNFSALVAVRGPLEHLPELLPGIAGELTLCGLAGPDQVQLRCAVRDFTCGVSGMAPLSFSRPQLTIVVRDRHRGTVVVAGDALVAGLPVPLEVHLRQPTSSWSIRLAPGTALPLANGLAFLGLCSDVDLLAALPSSLQALSGFVLSDLRIVLARLDGNITTLVVAISNAAPWSIVDGILQLTDITVELIAAPRGDSWRVTGSMTGALLVGSSLSLRASVPLPLSASAPWIFSASGGSLRGGLAAIDALFGGTTLSSLLPSSLGVQPDLVLQNLVLTYDPAQSALTAVLLEVASSGNWSLIPGSLDLTRLTLQLQLTYDQSWSLTGNIAGWLQSGALLIATTLTKATPDGDWTLTSNLPKPMLLPSLDDLSRLLGGQSLDNLLPAGWATAQLRLTDFGLSLTFGDSVTIDAASIGIANSSPWSLLDGALVLSDLQAYLDFAWSSDQTVTKGGISGRFLLGDALFEGEADYDGGWRLHAGMLEADSDGAGALDFGVVLAQLGGGALPTNIGLPSVLLTSADFRLDVNTGELHLTASSQLRWRPSFGDHGLTIADLGASLHRLPDGGQLDAALTGRLRYHGLEGQVSISLGSGDTIISGAINDLDAGAIATVASKLGDSPWQSITTPPDFPLVGLRGAAIRINLTQSQLICYGRATTGTTLFGEAGLIVQQSDDSWQYAFGFSLSYQNSQWVLSQLSSGLAPVQDMVAIDNATGAVVLSSFDGESLAALTQTVPALASVMPATTRPGANLYASVQLGNGLSQNAARVLTGGSDRSTLTLQALLTNPSSDSLFSIALDNYTLAGAVTFSNVLLQYQPSATDYLTLVGDLAVSVGGSGYSFTGAMQVRAEQAHFSAQSTQSIVEPLGMPGITLAALAADIVYQFPDEGDTSLSITLSGNVTIGRVANLTGRLFVLDGNPVVVAVEVERFGIENLYQQSLPDSGWPTSLAPLELVRGSIYYCAEDDAVTIGARSFQPGFNVAAQLLLFGAPVTVAMTIVDQRLSATGSFDRPLAWGFITLAGSSPTVGPSLTLTTSPGSLTFLFQLTLFGLELPQITAQVTNDDGEMLAQISVEANLPVFGQSTISLFWKESRGFWFKGLPLTQLPSFSLDNITSKAPGSCLGKQLIASLPIDGEYNFTTDYKLRGMSALEIYVQGYFSLTTMKSEILRINLQRLTITLELPSAGFSWGDIPGYVIGAIAKNSYAVIKQVLNDPASLAKLLAIEGIRYSVKQLTQALVCENLEVWGRGVAEEFVEAAISAFVEEVVVDGLAIVVGGIGVVLTGGLVVVGIASNGGGGPATPSAPTNLAFSFAGDTLTLSWSAAANCQTYGFHVMRANSKKSFGWDSNLKRTSATVPCDERVWGQLVTLEVCGNNQGLLGPSASATFQMPAPETTALMAHASGTTMAVAAGQLRQLFSSLSAGRMARALVAAYGPSAPTRPQPLEVCESLAVALRDGGCNAEESIAAIGEVFSATPQRVIDLAVESAQQLSAPQLAQLFFSQNMQASEAAELLQGVFALSASELLTTLIGAYGTLSLSACIAALAAAGFAAEEAAVAAVNQTGATETLTLATALAAAYPDCGAGTIGKAVVAVQTDITADLLLPALISVEGGATVLDIVDGAQALAESLPTLTALVAAPVLVSNYGSDNLPLALVLAFNNASPTDIAGALVAVDSAITAEQLAQALASGYQAPTLTAPEMAVALLALPSIDQGALAAAINATFSELSARELAQAILAAFQNTSGNDLATVLLATQTGLDAAQLGPALALVATGADLVQLLAQALPTATVADWATGLVAAEPNLSPGQVGSALLQSDGSLTAGDLASALVAACVQPLPIDPPTLVSALQYAFQQALGANDAAQAVLTGFPSSTPQALAQALAVFEPPLGPTPLAVALAAAIPALATTPSDLTDALLADFPQLNATDLACAWVQALAPGNSTLLDINSLVPLLQAAALATPPDLDAVAVASVAALGTSAVAADQLLAALVNAFADATMGAYAGALISAYQEPTTWVGSLATLLVQQFQLSADLLAAALVAPEVEWTLSPVDVGIAVAGALAPLTLDELASALLAAFSELSPTELCTQLLSIIGTPITALEMAAALTNAYQSALDINGLAVALVAGPTPPTPIDQLGAALYAQYPQTETTTFLLALQGAPYGKPLSLRKAARGMIVLPSVPSVLNALVQAYAAPPVEVGSAMLHANPSIPVNEMAQALMPESTPGLVEAAAWVAALASLYGDNVTPAQALAATNPYPVPPDPNGMPDYLCHILVLAYDNSLDGVELAVAVSAAMQLLEQGDVLDTQLAQLLLQYIPGLELGTLAQAITTALDWSGTNGATQLGMLIATVVPQTTYLQLAEAVLAALPDAPASDVLAAMFAFANPPDLTQVTPALVQTYPTDLGADGIASALYGSSAGPQFGPSGIAIGLLAVPFAVDEVLIAIVAAVGQSNATAAQAIAWLGSAATAKETANLVSGLLNAFTSPALSAADVAQALMPLPVKARALGRALVEQMEDLTPLVLAQTLAPYAKHSRDLAEWVVESYGNLLPMGSVGAALAWTDTTPALLAHALRSPRLAWSMSQVAEGIMGGFSTLPLDQLATTLQVAFKLEPSRVAWLAVALANSCAPSTSDLIAALQAAFSSLTTAELARALVAVLGNDETAVGSAILASAPSTTLTEMARALVVGCNLDLDGVAPLCAALASLYANASLMLDAITLTPVIGHAYAVPPDDELVASALVPGIASGLQLTICPNDVAPLALGALAAGWSYKAAGNGLAAAFGSGWNAVGFGVVTSVYTQAIWQQALASRQAGLSVSATAPSLTLNGQPPAALMVLVLTGVFDAITVASVTPIAEAMLAALYPLAATLGAMASFYAPNWTATQAAAVQAVYTTATQGALADVHPVA